MTLVPRKPARRKFGSADAGDGGGGCRRTQPWNIRLAKGNPRLDRRTPTVRYVPPRGRPRPGSNRGSSNGRTPDSGSGYQGSNPCPRTKEGVKTLQIPAPWSSG